MQRTFIGNSFSHPSCHPKGARSAPHPPGDGGHYRGHSGGLSSLSRCGRALTAAPECVGGYHTSTSSGQELSAAVTTRAECGGGGGGKLIRIFSVSSPPATLRTFRLQRRGSRAGAPQRPCVSQVRRGSALLTSSPPHFCGFHSCMYVGLTPHIHLSETLLLPRRPCSRTWADRANPS